MSDLRPWVGQYWTAHIEKKRNVIGFVGFFLYFFCKFGFEVVIVDRKKGLLNDTELIWEILYLVVRS